MKLNEHTLLRLALAVIGILGLIGIAKYTNWQTALLLMLVLAVNNAGERDTTVREITKLLYPRKPQ